MDLVKKTRLKDTKISIGTKKTMVSLSKKQDLELLTQLNMDTDKKTPLPVISRWTLQQMALIAMILVFGLIVGVIDE